MDERLTSVSKYLSYLLRHNPGSIGLSLDREGWAEIALLVELARCDERELTPALIEQAARENDKQRFEISADGKFVRARQGHSVSVDLGLVPAVPPAVLFHGTVARNLPSIRAQGIAKGARHHVHLSATRETAEKVGARYGKPVVLEVQASQMAKAGFLFYVTGNHVWLTDHVPPSFIVFTSIPPHRP